MIDVVIRGGEVVDGTGSSRRRADVGIDHGRVVAIGEVDERAARVIDAEGQLVAPGFIDVHTHLDAQVCWDGTLSPSPLHGVTTVVGGNCGFTIAPLSDDAAGYLMRMLARVEGMPLAALEAGVPWNWRTTAEYLDAIEGQLAVNAGFMVGHSAMRRVVMGEAATERNATADEMAAMETLLRQGLEAGGLGFSSTRSANHSDAEGNPVPSRHASDEEIIGLAAVCRDHPGTSLEYLPYKGSGPFPNDVIDLMASMSVAAQRPLNWNLLHVRADNGEDVAQRLSASDVARDRGGKVVALHMPMHLEIRMNFYSGVLLDTLPGWDKAMALAPADKLALLRNPQQRARLAEGARGNDNGYTRWADHKIAQTFTPETKRYEGRTVSDIAAAEGKDPFDALLDVVCADGLLTTILLQGPGDSAQVWKARGEVLRDRRALVGASDAGAHLDMLGTFNYATSLLATGVRQYEVITTEEAVQLLTQAPAQLYGLRDRGVLAPGAIADVVVFDEVTVDTEPLRTKADLPTGAPRLYAESTGISHVIVNGQPIVEDGTFTDARPGTVLRSGRDTVTPSMEY